MTTIESCETNRVGVTLMPSIRIVASCYWKPMTALSQALASFLSFSYTGPVESFNQEPRQTAREATASHPGQVTREISVGTRQKHSLSLSLLWERSLKRRRHWDLVCHQCKKVIKRDGAKRYRTKVKLEWFITTVHECLKSNFHEKCFRLNSSNWNRSGRFRASFRSLLD